MKLEIVDAIDEGDKIILRLKYDEEFIIAVETAFKIKNITEEEIEDIIMMVLENMSTDELELGDQVY